jgi:hypothetical protein
VIRRLLPLGILSLFLIHAGCDEGETSLGRSPGSVPAGDPDTSYASQSLSFVKTQSLGGAGLQTIGRDDSIGIESAMLFQFDYSPPPRWVEQPDTGSFHVTFSMKLANKETATWLPQMRDDVPVGESAFYMDLELSLLGDSLIYDTLAWDEVFAGSEPSYSVLDTLTFRLSSADTAYGDGGDPLEGVRSYVDLPASWFNDSLITSRGFLLRALPGQRGLLSCLASGYSSDIRPNLRFASWKSDSVDLGDGVMEYQTTYDTTSVAATWQSGVLKDEGSAEGFHSLSSGWASQVLIELPPFVNDSNEVELDPYFNTLSEAWLDIPISRHLFNAEGGKLNIYRVDGQSDSLDATDVELDPDRIVTSTIVTDSLQTLEFNIIGLLRAAWIEEDSLVNTDPIVLGLKFDDYYGLQARKIEMPVAGESGPRLRYTLSSCPEEWK